MFDRLLIQPTSRGEFDLTILIAYMLTALVLILSMAVIQGLAVAELDRQSNTPKNGYCKEQDKFINHATTGCRSSTGRVFI